MTYVELNVRTNFTFLAGASHPEEYVRRAADLGHPAIAITDCNSVAGLVRAHAEAKKLGQRILVGAELQLADGQCLVALPTDREAYGRLTRLITVGRRRAEKGSCELHMEDVEAHGQGTLFIYLPPEQPDAALAEQLARIALRFPGNFYLAANHLYRGDDARRIETLAGIAEAARVPLVASNAVTMHAPERRALADVLTCIREKCTIDQAGLRVLKNAERHLKSAEEMRRLFCGHEAALARTVEIADRIAFNLDQLAYEYPDEVSNGRDPQEELDRLVSAHVRDRYPEGVPAGIQAELDRELAIIANLRYAPYFLTVHDIVRFARENDILCQGRGSAANSLVCFVLGITSVSPDRMDMVFERFVSAARNEPPDIDVDFEHERREEVIQYIYGKYGRERAGLAATVISYRARSAVREVAKAMGLSADMVSALASQVWGWSETGIDASRLREVGLDPADARLRLCLELVEELIGFPRHLSQHVGGFVITRGRLDEAVPVENAAMEERTVIEWDKDDLDEVGMLKVDVLGLGMLTCIRKGFDLLKDHYGVSHTLASLPEDDAAVYDMLCEADSLGVFQVESRAQMSFLPRMRPRNFYDLVIEVAIVRPGPIQGDMVHPYLRRRNGEEKPDYPSEELREVLGRTLGVPLFQEQAMRIAIVGAGFTPDEADGLRRAMATFRRSGTIQTFRQKFISGMVARGYELDFAERCFRQIEGFGEYGFPESHAASFALLVYVSAWLKCHYPAAFACALLNSQPMGFYAPAQIVRDAREHGVEVRPPDVNLSHWDCTLEPAQDGWALRLGLRMIKGLGEDDAGWIVSCRQNFYAHPKDLWRRAGIRPPALEVLARADAYRSMGLERRAALWEIVALKAERPLPLFSQAGEEDCGPEPEVALPAMTMGEHVVQDYVSMRLTLRTHPLALLRAVLSPCHVSRALVTTEDGAWLSVAGIVLVRQRPGSAKGVVFITLEDETGIANIVVWPKTLERFRRAVMTARMMRVTGRLQRQGIVAHLVAERIEDCSHLLNTLHEFEELKPPRAPADGFARLPPPDSRDRSARGATRVQRHPRDQAKVLFPSRDFH
ncbi:error-prone DNA polymerase [Methyloceanibacter sp.]|uniref:error-prone DNA polymerase n=1 Tax=Methyloceanibacter sp. TaxID=1965321 RepID=UPI00351B249A